MADIFIFISYASEDRERIIPIVKALEEQGWSTWWDSTSIPVGKTWRQFIDEGLEAARCVLVIWSKTSVYSEWVLDEADFGKERKILVPAIIDDVRPPLGFRQMQAANLVNWNGNTNNPEFKSLLHAIEEIIGPPKPTIAPISPKDVLKYEDKNIRTPKLPGLIDALKDKDENVRRYAMQALGNIGLEAKLAVPILVEALNVEYAWVRKNAAETLGNIGPEATPAVLALSGALKDENKFVREAAASALEKINTPEAQKALEEYNKQKSD
jgi:hypothetical protein